MCVCILFMYNLLKFCFERRENKNKNLIEIFLVLFKIWVFRILEFVKVDNIGFFSLFILFFS